jgi:hypothetical protein
LRADPQQLGELLGADAIAFVRDLAPAMDVADHHSVDEGLQQVVQPLSLTTFLDRDNDLVEPDAYQRRDRLRLGGTVALS